MSEKVFLDAIFRYAENLKRYPLTKDERDSIVAEFNNGAEKDPASRAVAAVNAVVGGRRNLNEELRKSANLDNTQRLLQDLRAAAQQWQSAASTSTKK